MSLNNVQNKPRILAVGVAAIDFVASVSQFPQPDQKMRSDSLIIDGGGNAANTACAIGRLASGDVDGFTGSVGIATVVGKDSNGNNIIEGLTEEGVVVDHVERCGTSSPFTYIIVHDDEEGNTRTCIHQPSDGELSVEFVDKIPLDGYTSVHFDGRYPGAAVHLSRKCAEMGIPFSVDVEKPRDGLLDLLSNASVVVCNSNYVNTLLCQSKTNDDAELVERLRKVMTKQAPKADIVVTTLGAKGSCLILPLEEDFVYFEGNKVILKDEDSDIPVVTVHHGAMWCTAWRGCNVVDSTGAGDAFQGGFLAALWTFVSSQPKMCPSGGVKMLMNNLVLARALRIGTRVATMKLGASGARKGLPRGTQDLFIQSEFRALIANNSH